MLFFDCIKFIPFFDHSFYIFLVGFLKEAKFFFRMSLQAQEYAF